MNFKHTRWALVMLIMAMGLTLNAKVYTWDKFGIAFEAPDGGRVPFSFFQDPNSAEVDWDEMVITLQRYIKNENTNKKNLNERLKSRALGYNMYDTKTGELKVKGFKCYTIEGTMPDGTRCIIAYLVSEKTSTVLEVVVNYLLGNREVVEDMLKSFSEGNNQKPNEREKPKQKIQKKEDADKQEQEIKKEKRRKNEKVYEC